MAKRKFSDVSNFVVGAALDLGITDKQLHCHLLDIYKFLGGRCAITQVRLSLKPGKYNTLVIERVDLSKGYVKGNMILVCDFVSRGRNGRSWKGMYKFLERFYARRNNVPTYWFPMAAVPLNQFREPREGEYTADQEEPELVVVDEWGNVHNEDMEGIEGRAFYQFVAWVDSEPGDDDEIVHHYYLTDGEKWLYHCDGVVVPFEECAPSTLDQAKMLVEIKKLGRDLLG
jgi:hypothetical protein